MKKAKALLTALPITLLAVGLVTVPVFAEHGDGGSGSGSSGSGSSSSSSTSGSGGSNTSGRDRDNTSSSPNSGSSESETETENTTETQTKEQHLRTQGKELLQEARNKTEDGNKSSNDNSTDRTKRCEERKSGLQNKVNNLATNAQKSKNRIDEVFTKALAYQQANNVTVSNFDTLVAAANTAKSQAATSVGALLNLKPTVDCNSTSVASDVATFKAAAAQARTDLQTYKTAVKAILTALEAAKQ